ncbi:MAG: lectin [Gemmatimonas sp.]
MSSLSRTLVSLALIASPSALVAQAAPAQPPAPMTFFITSVGKGDGANLGGLEGADAHCKALADAVNAAPAGRTWHAYLSQPAANGKPAVNARDRIGKGPWHNQKGGLMAASVAALHADSVPDRHQMNKINAITEKGTIITGNGDTPNMHDILTGSDPFGRALAGTNDTSCSAWTSNAATGSAMVGHHDRTGGGNSSWNSAHASRGCGQQNLVATGGAGLFYCFAAN